MQPLTRYFLWLALVLAALCAVAVVAARAAGGLLPKPLMLSFVSDMNIRHWMDIYVTDMERRIAARVTNDRIGEESPVWSRDGRLAYISNRDGEVGIYVRETDGRTRKIAISHTDFTSLVLLTWSESGRLAFTLMENNQQLEIYVFDENGNLNNVTNNPDNDYFPAWSSDGQLAFTASRNGNGEIYVLKPDGQLINVTQSPDADYNPAWTPNGELTFIRQKGMKYSLEKRLPNGTIQPILEQPYAIQQYGWSPDGRAAILERTQEGFQIYILHQDNRLSLIPSQSYVENNPRWSSNGWLAYESYPGVQDAEVYVMNPEGEIEFISKPGVNASYPTWLP